MNLLLNQKELWLLDLWGNEYKAKCLQCKIPFEQDEVVLLQKIRKLLEIKERRKRD